jgi:hypothetical protein
MFLCIALTMINASKFLQFFSVLPNTLFVIVLSEIFIVK